VAITHNVTGIMIFSLQTLSQLVPLNCKHTCAVYEMYSNLIDAKLFCTQ